MSGPLSSGSDMAVQALFFSTGAAVAFPTFWPMVGEVFMLQCDPQAMLDAGEAWYATAEEIFAAIDAANAIATDVASHWSGPDQDAHAQRVQEFITAMTFDAITAIMIGAMMTAVAVLMFLLIVFAFVISGVLFFAAIYYYALLASVVGAPAAAGVLATMSSVAATSVSIFKASSDAVEIVTHGCAVVIGGFVAGGALGQLFMGNPEAIQSLGAATVDSMGTVTAGLMSYFLNKGIGQGVGVGKGPAVVTGVGGAGAGTVEDGLNPVNWPGLFDLPQNTDGQRDRP